ncbi:Fungal specific transcription factor domain [Teratosphaeria destructans]|uniref:Fungal specific transcription factor domain n=1 Tax=Teratosphaeria destructans TaxID=418781 RepID=A0A9W7SVI4_9PEZI|nr:Fungal specific transcription factor domain [Teratosphaeria destructans]
MPPQHPRRQRMELTFVHQYSGESPKRRRLAKACETCRARKKRCIHFAATENNNDITEDPDGVNVEEPTLAEPKGTNSGAQATNHRRFVSDLTPQSSLLERANPVGDIGVWVDKREYDALVRRKDTAPRTNGDSTHIISQGVHAGQRPHSAVLGPLIDVYFTKFHPILPLLDENEFRDKQTSGRLPEALAHAVCLVAAKDPAAEPHLRYGSAPSTLAPREFCGRLNSSVLDALRTPGRYDKTTLIQILALTSLHMEGADGPEEASMLLTQACHHATTLGIHLGQHANAPQGQDSMNKRLFWCLYALDRLNSVMNGRPIIMNDVDIAITPFEPQESGFPAFDAWLRITNLLNKTISFYRPHNPVDFTGWEDPYPGLEEIFDETRAWNLPQSVLSTIHLFYLATAMLSHRSRSFKQIPRGTHSSIRQRLCAIEVIRLLESEHCRALHGFPFIPYALSLALSVSYQHLRQSQLHHQQEDARSDFRRCTKLLHSLRRTWSSADTMTALAMKVLEGLEKAPSLESFRIPRGGGASREADKPCAPDISGARSGLELPSDIVTGNATNPVQQPALRAETNGDATLPTGMSGNADLFEGMDDVFGTYLDPNYPVNLDDMSFIDDLPRFDWNQLSHAGMHGYFSAKEPPPDSRNEHAAHRSAGTRTEPAPVLATPLQNMPQEVGAAARGYPYKQAPSTGLQTAAEHRRSQN